MPQAMRAKFGISLSNRAVLFDWATTGDLITAARTAEDSGYFHSVWVGDNLPSLWLIVRAGMKMTGRFLP